MQKYFKTGKTIVIDDQYQEAKPLLDALFKIQIPFYYTQGKPHSEFPLPRERGHYSLVFLDLNLDFKFAGSQIGSDSDEKTFKSTHVNILNSILLNRNRSYILIIWSNEEENFLQHFLNIFERSDKYYSEKIPYKIIKLTKSNYFVKTPVGDYEFIPGKETVLVGQIKLELEKISSFKFFCEWDNIVNQSVGDCIDDFMGLIPEDVHEDEEDELAKIITAISIAYSGEEGYLKLKENQSKTDSVLLSLTQILNDDIDRNVITRRQQEFSGWKASTKREIDSIMKKINRSQLNKKILLCHLNQNNITGSVYKVKKDKQLLKKVIVSAFETHSISKYFVGEYKKDHKNLSEEDINRIQDCYSYSHLSKLTIPIELNITPLCDIVQDKLIYHRLLTGLLIPKEYSGKLKKSDYLIKTPTFSYSDREYLIGLDLRTLSSCAIEDLETKEYLFSLRSNLINDIQTKVAAHVSRLGVFNI